MFLKAGDTAPKLIGDTNADLTGATVRLRMSDLTGVPVLDVPCDITDADNGIVEYQWVAPDTDVPGAYRAEFLVTFAGGEIERFPQRGWLEIIIADSIGVPV